MPIPLLLPRLRPSALFCVVLSATLLAACGNSSASAPSATTTSGPTAVASGSEATSSASPAASQAGGASEASASANASGGGGMDACTLVTSAELAAIVGGTIKGAEMLAGGWVASGCSWSGGTSSFIISIGTASSFLKSGDPAASKAQARLAQYKQQANGSDVSGFGEGAVLSGNGMAAYKGTTYVEVEKLRLTDDQLTKIMKLLISKL